MNVGTGARVVTVLAGLWLMAAPAVLGYGGPASASDRIIGPLAVSVGLVALWEATRPVRWTGVGLGAWLLVAPWLLGYGTTPLLNGSLAGTVLIGCAFVRGDIEQSFGGGWRAIRAGDRGSKYQQTGGGS
ncbi:MAG: SPW repeat domain-containing protein [Longimicrobiales bacterium]